ncbi:pyridoxal phosphate-dependent aminotransferase [Gudongella sp. DL1XJH-153]|uniref:pyridoxal phosphate-dependent aminotransferase n=1 Tax=Gudongella sp. DL1XJH-153 TaxID=3409804 RepID=UPI003BB75EA3
MKELSMVTSNYPASGIRKMFELAGKYDNVISLTVGEPAFDTPENIKNAAKQSLDNNNTHYVSNAGIPELRKTIAEKYNSLIGGNFTLDNVMVAIGGMEAIFLSMLATVNPGDEVLIPDPGYPNYEGQTVILGAKAVKVPVYEENNFNIQAKDIENAITKKTKVLILNSPSNPLGSVLSKDNLAEIAEVVKKHDLFVISDEVYEEIIYDGYEHHSISQFPEIRENVMIVNSLSKTYAMTGWRIGYVVGSKRIIDKMPKLQEGIVSCAPHFVQVAAIEAITNSSESVEFMRKEYARKRNIVVEEISKIEGLQYKASPGSFYAFVNIKASGMTSQEFAEKLVVSQQVLVVPGSAFGEMGEGYIRVVFAGSDDDLREAFKRMKLFVESLNH